MFTIKFKHNTNTYQCLLSLEHLKIKNKNYFLETRNAVDSSTQTWHCSRLFHSTYTDLITFTQIIHEGQVRLLLQQLLYRKKIVKSGKNSISDKKQSMSVRTPCWSGRNFNYQKLLKELIGKKHTDPEWMAAIMTASAHLKKCKYWH